jgi:16S rRNA processing protein RimM
MPNWDAMAAVGTIARAHGIRGQVIVNLHTDFPEARFRPGATLFTRRSADVTTIVLTTVRFQNGRPVVGIEGVETMNDAEALAGWNCGCRWKNWRRCRKAPSTITSSWVAGW